MSMQLTVTLQMSQFQPIFALLCFFIVSAPPSRTTQHIARLPSIQTKWFHRNQLPPTVTRPQSKAPLAEEKKSAASTKNLKNDIFYYSSAC